MVAADNEMSAAMVGANEPVPDRLARSAHTHRQVEQGHRRGCGWVLIKHRLIAAHAGEVIDVAGFGHAHHRVNEQIGLGLLSGAEGQFLMGAMQRVSGLKRHHAAPAHFAKIGPQLVGRVAPAAKVVMNRLLNSRHRPTEIDLPCGIVKIFHGRMGHVVGAKNLFGFAGFVRGPAVCDGHGRENDALGITQSDILAQLDGVCKFSTHIQSDRHGPKRPITQTHMRNHAVIICATQKSLQRIEPAVHQQFQIADLPRREIPRGELCRFELHFLCAVIADV